MNEVDGKEGVGRFPERTWFKLIFQKGVGKIHTNRGVQLMESSFNNLLLVLVN